jgi:serine phosphatase RsbU (regulator of sigma subunit)
VLIVVSAGAVWLTDSAVRGQERRLLKERANEVSAVLSVAVSNLASGLDAVGATLRATDNSPKAFSKAAKPIVEAPGASRAVALLRPSGTGFRVARVAGEGLVRGQIITGPRAVAIRRALTADGMVPTPVIGSGADRSVGFAVGPPQAPADSIVYQQASLGPLGPPSQAGEEPFSEVEIVLYGSPEAMSSQALVSTSTSLPLTGTVHSLPLKAGVATWRLEVRAVHPLVGTATADAPWIVAGAGLVLCVLLTAVVEIESRRRSSALALYTSEHRMAEDLQRELLPKLPPVAGLQISARYLPGTAGQQVGGDWYDVFTLDADRTGVVIGDVVGHDISAAATMSRVQSALRAYAVDGRDPAQVLDRLDTLLATVGTERLATVFYGELSAADGAGSRTFRYANAGHPPPLARDSEGAVRELEAASSLLLGTALPGQLPREVSTVHLAAGATLVLYTDGLVESPGESITDNIERLKADVTDAAADVSELCDRIVARRRESSLRDDLAVLAVRLEPARR